MIRAAVARLVFLLGVVLLVYPHATLILDDWSSQARVDRYQAAVDDAEPSDLSNALARASANPGLRTAGAVFDPFSGRVREDPAPAAWLSEDGVFGYLDVPRIGERLPLYLGATRENLRDGVAQIAGTSLPLGGEGTHSVIAGHRGWYGLLLFRHLDELQAGDLFSIHVFGRVLTYRVTGREVILPSQTEHLGVEPGNDLVTLLTCTPYGSATHRLLVRGERVPGASRPSGSSDSSGSPVPTGGASLPAVAPSTPVTLGAESGAGAAARWEHRSGSYALVALGALAVFVMLVAAPLRRRRRPTPGGGESAA